MVHVSAPLFAYVLELSSAQRWGLGVRGWSGWWRKVWGLLTIRKPDHWAGQASLASFSPLLRGSDWSHYLRCQPWGLLILSGKGRPLGRLRTSEREGVRHEGKP